jgi:hypothetical protein
MILTKTVMADFKNHRKSEDATKQLSKQNGLV